ncbi:MAG: LAGLIDADG family homing endonuclease, partial [Thermoproteota archaeon]|nr:LAGLIDADG family homing endonuclease [Thermoproteota archaeon]
KKAASEVEATLSKPIKRSLKQVAQQILSTGEQTRISEMLAKLIECGAAFHHAGLGSSHRRILENAFKNGKIKVIAATPTLAFGVNLPARTVVIHDYRRYEPELGYYPIPVLEYKQMCLPYNAKILLANGNYAKIGEIAEGKKSVKLTTLNKRTRQLQPGTVVRRSKRLAKKIVEIKVQHGEQIRVTPNHPLLTQDGWKIACDVRIGDYVAHITSIPYNENIPTIHKLLPNDCYVVDEEKLFSKLVKEILVKRQITKRELAEKANANYKTFFGWADSSRKNIIPLHMFMRIAEMANKCNIAKRIRKVKTPYGKPIIVPKLLTKGFLWLVGVVATDGNLNQTSGTIRIRIFNTNQRIITRARNQLKKLGLKHRLSKEGNCYKIEFSNLLIGKVLSKFGIPTGKKSSRLYISNVVKNLPKPLLSAYLSGVFDGDGNYTEVEGRSTVRMVRVVTKSKRFAYDLKEALLKLGVVSYVKSKCVNKRPKIRGKKTRFRGKAYYVIIRPIVDINAFFKHIHPTKRTKYDPATTRYKIRSGEKNRRSGQITWSKVVNKKTVTYDAPIPVYNVMVHGNSNYVHHNLVLHNCGRAGRPRYDKIGEALLIARNRDEQDYLMESYVLAKPERIWSKMAVERVLRSHVLATVAAGFAHTEQGVYDFFTKTFYAHQYGVRAIQGVIKRILRFLYKEKMIDASDGNILATQFGRRISELYIDPISGVLIREALKNRARKLTDLSFLHMVAHTPDMFPSFRAYSREINQLSLFVDEHRDEFMFEVPEEWEDQIGFEEFLGEAKTAFVLKEWMEETSEDEMIERFHVQPGDLYQLTRTAEWLLHSSHELATLLGCKDLSSKLAKLTERVERGVKKELLPLVKLKGVGRVRARILFNAGFQTLEDLRHASLESLVNLPLIGSKLTKKIKEQVGGFVKKEEWKKLKEKTWKQQALTEY